MNPSGPGSVFQYQDGNQANSKVLTSDASGNATWQAVPNMIINSAAFTNFVGTGAGNSNVSNVGTRNSSLGYNALTGNTTGSHNTAIGNLALTANTSGYGNTAIGDSALSKVTTGYYNTALGYGAYLTAALNNATIIGYGASGSTGGVAVGSGASSSGGGSSLALGHSSTSGGSNAVAIGYNATSAGNNSISIGQYANAAGNTSIAIGGGTTAATATEVSALPTGSIAIGYNTRIVTKSSAPSNITAIGYGVTDTVTNTMVFGNASVVGWGFGAPAGSNAITVGSTPSNGNGAKLTLAGAWTSASDSTKKFNIQTIKYGLKEVMKLRPVSYQWKGSKATDIGFIAQEVKLVLPELVFGTEGSMTLSYAQITSVLAKAIQEQQAQIESQKVENQKLQQQLFDLKKELDTIKNALKK